MIVYYSAIVFVLALVVVYYSVDMLLVINLT